MTTTRHIPVMLDEVLGALKPADGEVFVDATFGNGGYSEAILKSAATCKVIAIDRDPAVAGRAAELKAAHGARFEFVSGRFGDISSLISEPVDGFVFDIGVSSMQLDEAGRGFSFSKDAPLDMRMSQAGASARDLANELSEQALAEILYAFGEERKSRQIAHQIILARAVRPIETTRELAEIVYKVIHKKPGEAIDPATRTFQALRIAVNDELGELERGLAAAARLLKPGGRLVAVTFHSLEDRIAKNFFREKSGNIAGVSRYMPSFDIKPEAIFSSASKAITPSDAETASNARARSAKLRFATRKEFRA